MRVLTTILLIAAGISPAILYAQGGSDTVTIHSLSEVLLQALKHNPTQAIYQQQVKQASYNYKASKGFIYPNASAGFTGTDNLHLGVTPVPGILIGQPGTTFYAQFGKKYNYNTGITLTQNIFDWTAVMQSKIAGSNVTLSELQQDSYTQDLKEQVSRLYFSALIAKAALQINATDKLLADSIVTLTKQRLQEGTTDLLSLNQADISRSNIEQNTAQSQQLYDQSIENLKILLGERAGSEVALAENINIDSLTAAAPPAIGTDKTLQQYQQQAVVSELQSRSQHAAAYPKLSATMYIGGQQFRDQFGLSFDKGAWNPYRYIGVNLTVPVFTGLTNTYRYRSAQVQHDIATMQYENARQESETKDRLLLKNYADYLKAVKASAKSFRLYGDNLRLNQQKYQEGVAGMDVYLRSFQDYLAAQNAYLTNLSQLLSIKSTIISRQ